MRTDTAKLSWWPQSRCNECTLHCLWTSLIFPRNLTCLDPHQQSFQHQRTRCKCVCVSRFQTQLKSQIRRPVEYWARMIADDMLPCHGHMHTTTAQACIVYASDQFIHLHHLHHAGGIVISTFVHEKKEHDFPVICLDDFLQSFRTSSQLHVV